MKLKVYFQPAATARKICVKHLNDSVDLNKLYTPEVLTEDVLKLIEPIVNEKFTYGVDEMKAEDLTEIISTDDVAETA